MQQTATWINCHLVWMEELRMEWDPFSAVISMQSTVPLKLGPPLILIEIQCIFTPWSVRCFLQHVAPQTVLVKVTRLVSAWDQNNPVNTLNKANFDMFSNQTVFKGTQWLNLSKHMQGGPEIQYVVVLTSTMKQQPKADLTVKSLEFCSVLNTSVLLFWQSNL